MTDVAGDAPVEPAPPPSAGALLRAARQAQNLHIALLAANLKVPQARLEALEADRYDEMPDSTFVRALAQSVCRVLKIDAAPVLTLLPAPPPPGLDRVASGLNAPFRDKPGRAEPTPIVAWRQPVYWLVLLLLVAAAALAFWPGSLPWQRVGKASPVPAPLGPSAPAIVEPNGAAPPPAASASVAPAASAVEVSLVPATAAASAPPNQAVIQASAKTWVQVLDADGNVVLSRELAAGESAAAQGKLPLRMVIGNAQGTQLSFGGRLVDLAPSTRDNVARIELNLP